MREYKLLPDKDGDPVGVLAVEQGQRSFSFPLDPIDRNCLQFTKDWQQGATVLDPSGKPVPFSAESVADLGLPMPREGDPSHEHA